MTIAKKRSVLTLLLVLLIALITTSCTPAAVGTDTAQSTAATTAGTKDTTEKTDDEYDEYFEITLYEYSMDPRWEEYAEDNSFRQFLKDEFNFGYKLMQIPGDYAEFTNLRLAGGDYEALIHVWDQTTLRAYIEADALIPLNDLFDSHGQDFKARREEDLMVWQSFGGTDDGLIYCYTEDPTGDTVTYTGTMIDWYVRADILEQQDYPDLTNVEALLDIVEQGLKDNPETNGKPTIGITYPMGDELGMITVQALYRSNPSYDVLNNGSVYDWKSMSFKDVCSFDTYKAGIKAWNSAWRRGLMDKESLTDISDVTVEKFKENRVLAGFFVGSWGSTEANVSNKANGIDYRYVPIPLVLEQHQTNNDEKIKINYAPGIWSGLAITKNCEYPERLMEIINYLGGTEEGLVRWGWGEEGVQYTIDADGKRVATEDHANLIVSDENYIYTYQAGTSMFGTGPVLDSKGQNVLYERNEDVYLANLDPVIIDVWKQYGWDSLRDSYANNQWFKLDESRHEDFKKVSPPLTEDQKVLVEDVDQKTYDYVLQMVIAETDQEFEQAYADLMDMRSNSGLYEIHDLVNEFYDEMCEEYGISP